MLTCFIVFQRVKHVLNILCLTALLRNGCDLIGIKLKVDGELYAVDPDDVLLNLVPKDSKVRHPIPWSPPESRFVPVWGMLPAHHHTSSIPTLPSRLLHVPRPPMWFSCHLHALSD